ncbi:MAG TPA: PEP/pyruvate-binding domain-containing protein, partial [Candidatus Nanopelagicales bacterium]|nr:PEP/pyruvate-binding domain-containing protein [Candidatus Nanopelagicales bacterium]
MTELRAAPILESSAVLDWLWPLETVGQRRRTNQKRVGGKAWGLARLLREGYPVPRGWVLDARCFTRQVEEHLPKGHELGTVVKLAGTRAGVERAARARDWLLTAPLPAGLLAAIDALWGAIEGEAPWGLAVRSSATCEDTEESSLAGLAETALGARGPEAIAAGIRKVWASAYLPRAIAYLARVGLREASMGVVLQIMVPAEAAGVLFTAPPPGLEGEAWPPDERLINATVGLGAPVVEGSAAVDTFRIARRGGAVVDAAVARKRRALGMGAEGLDEITLSEEQAAAPSLGPEALRELSTLADRLEEGGGGPFDVEFAVEKGRFGAAPKVWLLQVRPLRGGSAPEGGDAETVWSRANVGEALPGA